MDLREATTPDDRQGPLSRAVRRAACGQGCLLMRVPSLTHHAPWRSGVRHSLDVRPPPSQGPAESVRRGAPAHPIAPMPSRGRDRCAERSAAQRVAPEVLTGDSGDIMDYECLDGFP